MWEKLINLEQPPVEQQNDKQPPVFRRIYLSGKISYLQETSHLAALPADIPMYSPFFSNPHNIHTSCQMYLVKYKREW